MRTKLYNLLKAVSGLTSAGPGPAEEQVCPGSGPGTCLRSNKNLNQHLASIVYTMVPIIQRYTHTILQH